MVTKASAPNPMLTQGGGQSKAALATTTSTKAPWQSVLNLLTREGCADTGPMKNR